MHSTLIHLADSLDALGLHLNLSKCSAYSKTSPLHLDMFPSGLQLHSVTPDANFQLLPAESGFKLLGVFVGSDDFILERLDQTRLKFASSLDKLSLVKENPQIAFLLLRFCLNQKLMHLLRTTAPQLSQHFAVRVDHLVNKCLMDLFGLPHHVPSLTEPLGEWSNIILKSRLPGAFGGVGVTALSAMTDVLS